MSFPKAFSTRKGTLIITPHNLSNYTLVCTVILIECTENVQIPLHTCPWALKLAHRHTNKNLIPQLPFCMDAHGPTSTHARTRTRTQLKHIMFTHATHFTQYMNSHTHTHTHHTHTHTDDRPNFKICVHTIAQEHVCTISFSVDTGLAVMLWRPTLILLTQHPTTDR